MRGLLFSHKARGPEVGRQELVQKLNNDVIQIQAFCDLCALPSWCVDLAALLVERLLLGLEAPCPWAMQEEGGSDHNSWGC